MVKHSVKDRDRLTALRDFFCSENKCSSAVRFEIGTVSVSRDDLSVLVGRFVEKKTTALPFFSQQKGTWVGILEDDFSEEDFLNAIYSFVIPSFGTSPLLREPREILRYFPSVPPNEIAPRGWWEWNASAFEQGCGAVALALSVLGQRPPLLNLRPTPPFEVLGKFQEALMARDFDDAEAILLEIKSRSLVSQINFKFLQVQLLEVMGRWDDILTLPNIHDLTVMKIPATVKKAVLKACYYARHAKLEGEGRYVDSFERFRQSQTFYASILRGAEPGGFWISDRLLAYRAAANSDQELLKLLIERSSPADLQVIQEVQRLMAPAVALTEGIEAATITRAQRCAILADEGRYQEAFLLAKAIENPAESTRMQIKIAFEAGSSELIAEAKESVRSLPEAQRDSLIALPPSKKYLEGIGYFEGKCAVNDWIGWVGLAVSTPEESGLIRDKARDLKDSWSPGTWGGAQSQQFANDMLNAITMNNTQSLSLISECYPFTAASFINDESFPRPILIESYKVLYELAVELMKCSSERSLYVVRLAEGISALDPDFVAHLAGSYLTWVKNGLDGMSRAYAENLYEVIEVLAENGVASDLLANLWVAASSFLHLMPNTDPLDPKVSVWKKLGALCGISPSETDVYFPQEGPRAGERPEDSALQSAKIAIFTLMTHPAERAAGALKKIYPGIDVRVNADEVATVRAMDAAKNSDAVVLVTQAMKHALFYQIDQIVEKKKIVYPKGRGSASIIDSIVNWAKSKPHAS